MDLNVQEDQFWPKCPDSPESFPYGAICAEDFDGAGMVFMHEAGEPVDAMRFVVDDNSADHIKNVIPKAA
jgi:hypothetical protein